jgi:ribonuclease P protein component
MPRSLTFPRTRRLILPAEFKRVRAEGEVQRGEFLMLGVLRSVAAGKTRAGFVTSGRLGGAIVRNRLRRRLRDIVRRHQHELVDDAWIVLIPRAHAVGASYEALEHEWLRLAKRASILAP